MEIAAAIPTLPQPRRRRDISLKPGVYEGRILRARSRIPELVLNYSAIDRQSDCAEDVEKLKSICTVNHTRQISPAGTNCVLTNVHVLAIGAVSNIGRQVVSQMGGQATKSIR